MKIPEIHELFLKSSGISTDTRKIGQGSMFVAIKGEKYDANAFASEALEKGASYVILDNPDFATDGRMILVPDSLEALQQLSAFHRNYLGIPIVGLTGSNGKTTTKELINAVLSQKFKTGATVGNLNNHIGLPLTLLSFTNETEIGIVEMGANHQKEIEFLCVLCQPDLGYITNFGKAHLEGFGGVEGVIKGKSEIYGYLRANEKIAIVNLDDTIQNEKTHGIRRHTFAVAKPADTVIDKVSANPFVQTVVNGIEINSNLIGLYNSNNINAATAIGHYFGISDEAIKAAIEGYVPSNNRSQIIAKGSNQILLDAYNANPSSMAAAIANFLQLDKPNKAMLLGDMFELGEESIQEHREIVKSLESKQVPVYFIGKDFAACKSNSDNLHFYQDFDSFASTGIVESFDNATVLVKGSRGMALERLLDYFRN